MVNNTQKDILSTSQEAAEALGYSEYTLRLSRTTGTLAGVQAPPFIKQGRRIRYRKSDLEAWQAQFTTFTSTAQAAMASVA